MGRLWVFGLGTAPGGRRRKGGWPGNNSASTLPIAWRDSAVEGLERRALLSAAPVAAGAEFRVNTNTTGSQELFAEAPHAVASDADGDFVVTWSSSGQDGSAWGVYAQRYGADGAKRGAEFRVNQTTSGSQWYPTVACDAGGDFVVAWTAALQDGSGDGVFARRYDASGAPAGDEFRVNTTTSDNQRHAVVAMDAAGAFLVAWSGFAQPGGEGWDVYAQRYDAAGARQGSEFRVNATTAGDQQYPAVALDGAGNSVITWTTAGQDGAGTAVYTRRFSASGAAQGTEFRVNSTTAGDQQYSRVTVDATGNFVIAWASAGQDGSGRGVYGQRFSSTGAKRGGEFQVNQVTAGEQFAPTVAGDDAGGFVVTWTGAQDGDMFGVFARAYDPAGAPRGGEFRVNSHVPGNQVYSAATSSGDGKLVIVWESDGQDGSAFGVYGQRYAAPDTVAPTADVVNVSPDPRTGPVDTITVRFSEAVTGFGVSDLRLTRDGLPANLLTAAQTLASADDVTFTLGNLAALTATPGSYTLTLAAANSGITDAAGNPLAGDASDAWTVAPPPARVVARHVFYNGSGFDGRDDSAGVADDDAIAPDKVALLPGAGRATFANYTSYVKGINGVMIDVEGLTAGAASGEAGVAEGAAAPGVADFTFRVGNSPDTAAWAVAPQIASVTVRSGAGVNGSDRVTLVWPDGAVRHQWLQVTVLATAATRLAAPDVFFFGNLPGETGDDADGAAVDAADVILTRAAVEGGSASLSSRFDHDRNGRLDARDLAIARAAAGGKPLQFIGTVAAPASAVGSSTRADYRPPQASEFLSENDDPAGLAGADELVQ